MAAIVAAPGAGTARAAGGAMPPVLKSVPDQRLEADPASPWTALALAAAALLAGCAGGETQSTAAWPRPQDSRALLLQLLPASLADRAGWATDVYAAFSALQVPPTASNFCAALGVIEQESSFQADPAVPTRGASARTEPDERAGRLGVPSLLVSAALQIPSSDGRSYAERIDKARTERQLSDTFEDLIERVPLGQRLFGKLNPVRTAGPMQVSVAWAEAHAQGYPYPLDGGVRQAVFSRRGGLYFGIAHLLDYAAPYDDMVYRFADFNAGHYASRNAAFQNAVNIVTGKRLALDGDLVIEGSDKSSDTELAIRTIEERLDLNDAQIRSALERGGEPDFERTQLYSRVLAMADKIPPGRPVPRAMVPRIRLESPKITRNLTTDWFARRVDNRYTRCLAAAR
jgi:hypothetical protein